MAKEPIITEETFYPAIERIGTIMLKGEASISSDEMEELRSLALAVQAYEHNIYKVEPPSTPEGIAEMEMYRQKLLANR